MTKIFRVSSAIVAGIGGWFTFSVAQFADDGSELNYGLLTGPMIGATFLAGITLCAAAIALLFSPKTGRIAILTGWALALPWASWLLFPGVWCSNGMCSVSYRAFVFNASALILICLPLLALWLSRRG